MVYVRNLKYKDKKKEKTWDPQYQLTKKKAIKQYEIQVTMLKEPSHQTAIMIPNEYTSGNRIPKHRK